MADKRNPGLIVTDPNLARSFDEWFNLMWKGVVGVPTPPELAELKNRLWLAIREHEELTCPYCQRKFPGESMTYADVTNHGYKCKQNPTRDVARLLADLWNATVAARQMKEGQVDLRHYEAKIAPLLSRWGFGAAQATVPEPMTRLIPDYPAHPDYPDYPLRRGQRVYRRDSEYPNHGTVKNFVRVGPSGKRVPAYCVEWEDGSISNIKVEDSWEKQWGT